MEKKLFFTNQWFYVFQEMSLKDLMRPAGEVTVHSLTFVNDLTRYPITLRLKKEVEFGSYQEAVERGVIVNKYTRYVYLPGGSFMGSDLSDLPCEGTSEIMLKLPLNWRVEEGEIVSKQQIRAIYRHFAEHLLGPWYII